jgi:predicted RNA-binding protein Jag
LGRAWPPLDFSQAPPPLTRPAAGEEVLENPADEFTLQARAVVESLLTRMGFTAEIGAVRLGSRLVLNLDSPDKAILIGARGATLEALQVLSAKLLARQVPPTGRPAPPRLVLDVADYRFRRRTHILETLKALGREARLTRQPQAFAGLNSDERRLVQLALRPFKDLSVRGGKNGGAGGGLLIVPSGSGGKKAEKPAN